MALAASTNHLDRILVLKMAMSREAGKIHLLAPDAGQAIRADYERLYAKGRACHFIEMEEDTIIAMAGAFIKEDLPFRYYSNSRYGFIGDVYVVPAHRNRGLAAGLSKELPFMAQGKGRVHGPPAGHGCRQAHL